MNVRLLFPSCIPLFEDYYPLLYQTPALKLVDILFGLLLTGELVVYLLVQRDKDSRLPEPKFPRRLTSSQRMSAPPPSDVNERGQFFQGFL
jgi:hypothetical protein